MAEMEYVKLPYVNKPVSRILFGTAMEPFVSGKDGGELLDAVYSLGVTAFDTARNYAMAESSLGRWIEERGLRDKVVVLSKCGHPDQFWNKRVNAAEMHRDLQTSLQNLRTDHIDVYVLHRDDPDVPVDEIVETFNEMHADGKIGAFGGSNWTHQRIAEANEYAYKHDLIPFTVSSPNFGLADQIHDPWGGGSVSISGPQNEDAREWYVENGMAVVAYSSLGRGLFSGKVKSDELGPIGEILDGPAVKGYVCEENFERLRRCEKIAQKRGCAVSQIAMAWIWGQKINTFAVVSTSNALRMRENIESLHIKLSEDELMYLDLKREKI